MKIAVPTQGDRGLRDRVADTFSRAPYFTLVTVENGGITGKTVIQNKAAEVAQGAGPLAARTLKDNGVDVLLSGEIGPGATNILEALGIIIGSASIDEKVRDAVDRFLAKS
ncbi:MAG TPA: NifB/NifX family molybdenum-iron cluster-binding protein [Candidatus Bathyarchaeia archaeon]